ncbi:MAG: hypothetical protein U9M95_01580, partial [Candidatus Altiarchaeota archaeon]|nr:hypothetical protein [Candidatus Altiarchaeota archaeon]
IEAVNYKNPLNAYSNPAGAIYNAEISFNREIQTPEFISPLVAAAILLVSPAFAYLLIKKRARPP